MKTLITKLKIPLLLLALVVSIAANVRQWISAVDNRKTIASLIESEGKNTIVKLYIRDSVQHTVFRDKIIEDKADAKALALGKTYADSLEKALKISIDKIDQVSKINAQLVAQLQLKATQNSQGNTELSYADNYLKLRYFPQTDSVQMSYDIRLHQVHYNQRKWLFGKRESYTDIFSADPRVRINGLNAFRIREPPPRRFGIGLHAGYGLILPPHEPPRMMPLLGIGLNYNLIEF